MKRLFVVSLAVFMTIGCNPALAANLYPPPKFSVYKSDGTPCVGCCLWTYEAGTSTPKDTYSDSNQTAINTNPVVFDSRGEADINFVGSYKVRLEDNTCDQATATHGTLIWSVDNYGTGSASSSVSGESIIVNGSFENDTSGNGEPDDWVVSQATGGAIELAADENDHGQRAIKFTSASSSGAGYIQSNAYFEVSEDRSYLLTFLVKSSLATVKNIVQMEWFTDGKAAISTATIYSEATSNPTSWAKKTFNVTPPATTRYAKIKIQGAESTGADGNTWVDDVRLEPVVEIPADLITNIQNLKIDYATTTTLTVSFTCFYNNAKVAVSKTLDIGTTGANSLDTGTVAADTAYSIYAIQDGTNVSVLASTNHTEAPTYPAGYNNARFIGATVTNSSSQFRDYSQKGNIVWFAGHEQIATGLTATAYTAQSISNVVPTVSNRVRGVAFRGTSNTGTNTLYLSDDGTNVNQVMSFDSANTDMGDPAYVPISGNNIYYKVSANSLTLLTLGYQLNL